MKVLKLDKEQTYKIEGMTCASCIALIEDESRKIQGVEKISVNFASEKASLRINELFSEANFYAKLESLGYRAYHPDQLNDQGHPMLSNQKNELWQSVGLLSFGILLMVMMYFSSGNGDGAHELNHQSYNSTMALINAFQLASCSIIFLIYSKKYIKNMINFLTKFQANMHTLIGIGLVTSLIQGLYTFIKDPSSHLYVESIPFILGFTLLGNYFEKMAKTKAQSSLSDLYKMQIKFASKMIDSKIENVPVIELNYGDVIRIRPGEKIPINGTVVKGESHVDESLMSGESLPVTKKVTDLVMAGSLNLDGLIDIEVKEKFHDSSVAQMIKYIENAESKKTKVEIFAQKIIKWFVPGIILIALITFSYWYFTTENTTLAVKYFMAVLLIACPCTLGLAVPISIMISTREALKSGLLVNGGEVFEIGESIDTVVLDKTGTLTEGHPEVVKFKLYDEGKFGLEILSLISSAASFSAHPLAESIVRYFSQKNVSHHDPDKFKNYPGLGFIASIKNSELVIGSQKFLEMQGIQLETADMKDEVGSRVFVGLNAKHLATMIIADKARLSSKEFIARLKQHQMQVWMLTGDNEKTAQLIAHELGIENVMSQVTPMQKADFILSLKKEHHKVAMVGDGINDAAALSLADISIAMASGSDLAISSSQVSLLHNDLSLISDFFERSKKTKKIIVENLFFSFLYNVLCIPLAAGIFVSRWGLDLDPKWASLSMGLSSTSVILSSMRLKKK